MAIVKRQETAINPTAQLHGVIADHLTAVNQFDADAIAATFADDALVNDNHREFWGRETIRAWIAAEMVGDRVTIEPVEESIITARRSSAAVTTASTTRPTCPRS